MKRVKIVVAYDGTNYCGWQVQPNGLSVQEVLEKHLSDLLGEEIRITGASRTDAGVHALGKRGGFQYQRTDGGGSDLFCHEYPFAGRYPYSGIRRGADGISSALCQYGKNI